MAQPPSSIPPIQRHRFLTFCHWFWHEQTRLWKLLTSAMATTILGGFISYWFTNDSKTTDATRLGGIITAIIHNWLVLILILIIYILILIFTYYIAKNIPLPQSQSIPTSAATETATAVSVLTPQAAITRAPVAQTTAAAVEQQEQDLQRAYLSYLRDRVKRLSTFEFLVPLADVFITLQFRESSTLFKFYPLDLQALDPKLEELGDLCGIDPRHLDYLQSNPKSKLERTFMQQDRLEILDLWQRLSPEQPVAVIQGASGMGKSTLLSRITLSMANAALGQPDTQLPLTPTLIPILVNISDYVGYLEKLPTTTTGAAQEQQRSLLSFLLADIHDKLKKQGSDDSQAIAEKVKHWLRFYSCLIMFDGLDEVCDKTFQHEIQYAIHEFIEQQRHPDMLNKDYNRFLITSCIAEDDSLPAFIGYPHFLIAELSRKQIEEFLPRWYQASLPRLGTKVLLQKEQLKDELISAFKKNRAVEQLAENPRLLTLMASMHSKGTQLPEHRIELYGEATRMLLEKHNMVRGHPKLDEDEAIQCLGKLAFSMQKQGCRLIHRSKVEASTITSTQYSGIFALRTGDYYGFVYRSFQEYFATRYILRLIDGDRKQIRELLRLVRDSSPTIWRELFVLAATPKSPGESVKVADDMIRSLLRSRTMRDLLLAATSIIEADIVSIDRQIQQEIATRLLSHYQQAQEEQRFGDCQAIENVVRDWLLILPTSESDFELPHSLLNAIRDSQHPAYQRSTLTLLSMIIGQLLSSRYDIHTRLIPSLLALTGMDAIGNLHPDPKLSPTTNFDVADLALTTMAFMRHRGPAGALLREIRQYFEDNPKQLRNLALYSLESGTLLTPTFVPINQAHNEPYVAAIGRWIELRKSYTPKRISDNNIDECLKIHRILLDHAEDASYPTAIHLKAMLQRASSDPKQAWKSVWQDYLHEQLEQRSYLNYQSAALLWNMLFPDRAQLQLLTKDLRRHYLDPASVQHGYSQKFIRFVSINLIYSIYLGYWIYLGDSFYLHYLNYLRHLGYLIYLNYLNHLTYLRDLSDLRYLSDLSDLGYWNYFRDLSELIYLMDLSDLVDLKDSSDLRYLNDFRYLSYLSESRDLLLEKDITAQARKVLPTGNNSSAADVLLILMGRVLQIQEADEIGPQLEAEIKELATAALQQLSTPSIDSSVRLSALEVLRALPARTRNEIIFILDTANRSSENAIHRACATALKRSQPKDSQARNALEEGRNSPLKEIQEAVEWALQPPIM